MKKDTIEKNGPYFAFISYSHKDKSHAKWIQKEIRDFHLPAKLADERKELKAPIKVYRDEDSFNGGIYKDQRIEALKNSENLVVVCSLHTVDSQEVRKEIDEFNEICSKKGLKKNENIVAFVIDGEPNSKNESKECYPEPLKGENGPIAGNVEKLGKGKAFAIIMAGMLKVPQEMIWDQYQIDKKKEKRKKIILWSLFIIFCIGIIIASIFAYNKHLINQSNLAAEKAILLTDNGDSYTAQRLLLSIIPDNPKRLSRIYTPELEYALRYSTQRNSAIIKDKSNHVTISPDGNLIASACMDNTVKIWDARTGKNIFVLKGHKGFVLNVAFAPDGRKLASAGLGSIIIWDVTTGDIIKEINDASTIVSFSPDSRQIAFDSFAGTIKVWDIQTETIVHEFTGDFPEQIAFLGYSPDGKTIISSFNDNSVRGWDVKTGKQTITMYGHRDKVIAASFSPDCKHLATLSLDSTVRIWNLDIQQSEHIFKGNKGIFTSILYSPDGQHIISSSEDNSIKKWNASTCEYMETIQECQDDVSSLALDSKGTMIVYKTGPFIGLCELSTEHDNMVLRHQAAVNSIAYDVEGEKIVSASWDETIKIWDSKTHKELLSIQNTPSAISAVYSRDNKYIAAAFHDHTVKLFDSKTGFLIRKISDQASFHSPICYSPDGQLFAIATLDSTVEIFNTSNMGMAYKLKGHKGYVVTVCFSPSGKYIATGSVDSTVRIWDAQTGKELKVLSKHNGLVCSMAFSLDESCVVSTSNDVIYVWDVNTGNIKQTLRNHSDAVFSVSFSPDGKYFATSSFDKTVIVWDYSSMKAIQTLKGHDSFVFSVSFNPKGGQIVSCSNDHSIRIWDFPSFERLINTTKERFRDYPLSE